MPSGCEFICRNETCEHTNKGFTMSAPWPLGRIELIINAPNVKNNDDFRQNLIQLKNDGRKYACITFPNESNILFEGYRVNFWSPEAKCLWQYDVMVEEVNDIPLAIDEDDDIPNKCPSTNGKMLTFTETVKEGINCPHCGEKMEQSRWFTNEI